MSDFSSVIKDAQNKFHSIIQQIGTDLGFIQTESEKVAKSAIAYIKDNGGQVLQDAAKAAVLAADSVTGGGKEKFAAAFAAVCHILVTEGATVIESAVNLAIEMAVADAKQAGLIH